MTEYIKNSVLKLTHKTPLKTRKFVLKDSDGVQDYTVIHEEFKESVRVTTMYRSENKIWIRPGEMILRVIDDGNGYFITHQEDRFTRGQIGYHTWANMFLLMRTIHTIEPVYMGSITEEITNEEI